MNQPLSEANGAIVWLICLTIGFILSIFHSISKIKRRKAARQLIKLESEKVLNKKTYEIKGGEFKIVDKQKKTTDVEYEDADPVYGRIIGDGDKVLTDEGEVIYLHSRKDGNDIR